MHFYLNYVKKDKEKLEIHIQYDCEIVRTIDSDIKANTNDCNKHMDLYHVCYFPCRLITTT